MVLQLVAKGLERMQQHTSVYNRNAETRVTCIKLECITCYLHFCSSFLS